MIKLGKLAQKAMDKEFPDNWKSLAIMMNIPYTMYDDDENSRPEDTSIEFEFSDNITLAIKADNSIVASGSVPKDMIGQLIIELAQSTD